MPEQYAVRAATVEDAVGIAAVHVASWRSAYRGLLPQSVLDGLSVERRTRQWHRDIGNGLTVHLAADLAGRIGGFVATGPSRDDDAPDTVGEFVAIYLLPAVWSTGLGSRLHSAAVTDLATRFEQATLWVLDNNTRARGFYERHGWQPDGTVKADTIGDAEVAEVRYRRSLPA